MSITKKLEELGIVLPEAPSPRGLYSPYVISGSLLYLSGTGGLPDGQPLPANTDTPLSEGRVGAEYTLQDGKMAARASALSALAMAKAALGSLDRVVRIVKMTGFVASAPGFHRQPEVMNGASELFAEVFGKERGLGVRSAVGVASLPFGLPVEIEVTMEILP